MDEENKRGNSVNDWKINRTNRIRNVARKIDESNTTVRIK